MIKLGELHVNDGRWHGKQVVSAAWVRESTSQQLTPAQEEAAQTQYGYLWWTGEYKGHAGFAAQGRFYQKILCHPDVDVAVVVTADDLTTVDTLHVTMDPLLEKVIFNPLLQQPGSFSEAVQTCGVHAAGERSGGSSRPLADVHDVCEQLRDVPQPAYNTGHPQLERGCSSCRQRAASRVANRGRWAQIGLGAAL